LPGLGVCDCPISVQKSQDRSCSKATSTHCRQDDAHITPQTRIQCMNSKRATSATRTTILCLGSLLRDARSRRSNGKKSCEATCPCSCENVVVHRDVEMYAIGSKRARKKGTLREATGVRLRLCLDNKHVGLSAHLVLHPKNEFFCGGREGQVWDSWSPTRPPPRP
jgi:hypothetical protein